MYLTRLYQSMGKEMDSLVEETQTADKAEQRQQHRSSHACMCCILLHIMHDEDVVDACAVLVCMIMQDADVVRTCAVFVCMIMQDEDVMQRTSCRGLGRQSKDRSTGADVHACVVFYCMAMQDGDVRHISCFFVLSSSDRRPEASDQLPDFECPCQSVADC